MNPAEYDDAVEQFYFDKLEKGELRQLILKMLSDRNMYEWFRLNKIILS
jgi:hypothetical protein